MPWNSTKDIGDRINVQWGYLVYKTLSMVSNAAGSLLGDKTQNLNAKYFTKKNSRRRVQERSSWTLVA